MNAIIHIKFAVVRRYD